jgi:chorismate-pyruvate lyase
LLKGKLMRSEVHVTPTEERRNETEFFVENSQGKRPLGRILLEQNLEE